MSVGPDTLKVMKWDGVDVLFWLTLHDCMNLFDTIRLNVAKVHPCHIISYHAI